MIFPPHSDQVAFEATSEQTRAFVGALSVQWIRAQAEAQGNTLNLVIFPDMGTFVTNAWFYASIKPGFDEFTAMASASEALLEFVEKQEALRSYVAQDVLREWIMSDAPPLKPPV